MTDDDKPPICRQVWDRAVEGGDVMADPALAAHVGSCVTCFRTLAELRDAPRLAAALRADAPALPVSDRFWDDLAARTSDAAATALSGPAKHRTEHRTEQRTKHRAWRTTGIAATLLAAAAVVLVAGRVPVGPPGVAPAAPRAVASVGAYADDGADDTVDVADLDESALRQLLARLRAHAPGNVAAIAAGGDAQDAVDTVMFDDDGQLNEELAELDGPALLRIARSLAGAAL